MTPALHILFSTLPFAPVTAPPDGPDAPTATASSPALRWTVLTADGANRTGRIATWRLDAGLSLRDDAGSEQLIASDSVVRLTNATVGTRSPGAAADGEWIVESIDGERVGGTISGGGETTLSIRHPRLGELSFSLDRLARIERADLAARDPADDRDADEAPPSEDQVWLRNGDHSAGIIDRLDERGVSLQTGRRRQEFPWSVLRRVRLANPEPKGPPAARRMVLACADGAVLIGEEIDWRDDRVRLTRAGRAGVTLNASDVRAIRVDGGRWCWLSDLPPAKFEATPFMDLRWPMRRDRNVVGGPLVCGGEPWDKGVGLHSAARVTWTLEGRYERLAMRVGIDDSGGRWSDVDVEIRLDGRAVTRFEHVRWGEPPRPVDLDMSGVRELTIVIGFGDHGDLQDRVNLLDAALVRR
ncbi:MAG: NPCBM/NEW2 domain-containing protein [Phycisphaerae bacterium]|nr:NPCBM/NEW2 domain-containing protein [Phycisphaerae bacterium]NUQ48095.1 NPCBM/NEW2 domain-containing protein [Phycisphaerae bacterium]